jgi:hypothetical protein
MDGSNPYDAPRSELSPGVPEQPQPPHSTREYLATVRRSDGRKVTENVVANTADEAVRFLRERGCDEIVLHNDDVMALFTRQRKRAEHISPRDYLLLRNLSGGFGFFVVVTLKGYRKTWFVMVVMALALAQLRYAGRQWALWDCLCVAVLLFPPAFALIGAFVGGHTRRRHQQMMDALYSGRWEEALRRADRVGLKARPDDIALSKSFWKRADPAKPSRSSKRHTRP